MKKKIINIYIISYIKSKKNIIINVIIDKKKIVCVNIIIYYNLIQNTYIRFSYIVHNNNTYIIILY